MGKTKLSEPVLSNVLIFHIHNVVLYDFRCTYVLCVCINW